MDDGTPALGVGFAIETGSSFEELARLQTVMDSAEARIVADAAKIERATAGMVNLGGATAQVTAFGNAHSREMQNVIRDRNNAEKSGEALIRQLERQAETYGKTAVEIRNMRAEQKALAAEAQGLTELAARVRAANAAMVELESGTGRVTTGAVKNRMAMQGASYQVQDFITQVSMGANPVNAFAVQGAQLAGQFSMIEGKAGDVARFFMGPWGLAITAGAMLIAPFVAKLFEGNNELDKAIDKLKKDAHESDVTSQAKARFSKTQEGLNAAIRDQVEALRKSQISQTEQLETAAKEAVSRANLTLRIREQTAALIDQAKAQLAADMSDTTSPDMNRAFRRQQLPKMIAELEARLGQAQAGVKLAQEAVDRANVALGESRAKALTDPIVKINEQADAEVRRAKAAALASHMSVDAIANEIAAINRRRDAAVKAEEERQRATKQTAQIGREVDLAEARRIAESIGARITSEKRSYEEQKRLYDKYMAYKAGKGPWAALAAAPGTSDHELGNALDIAKTPGMSLAKIRAAFREAGVSIKQLLDEGSHFHVAWKKGADTAAAASKKLADVQAGLAKQFDPAEAAALEYKAALKSIADAKLDPATATRYADAAAEAFRKARAAAFTLPSMAGVTADADAQKAAEKSAEQFRLNVIQPLKDELALYGLVGPARAAAALELEKEAFIAKNMDEGVQVATERWQQYYAAKKQLNDKDAAVERDAAALKRLNDELAFTADRWDLIARNVQSAARGMADAFGEVGQALGSVVDIYADFRAQQERAAVVHKANMDAAKTDTDRQREMAKYTLETSTAQVGMYGDMASAAKGFFNEKSKGYQAMLAAEKVFRAFEFAMSVRSMVQDVAETISSIANSGARATAAGAEGVANQSKLPFPFNIAAMAATAAALVAAGIAILGSGGGGASTKAPTNTGTGTVLGDPAAQSESIKNAIEALNEVDTVTSVYARQMASSLRSIENQIGGIASLVVRAGDVNASGGVTEGFKASGFGSLLGNIPLIGGILKGLFGSTTTVTGSGLFGGAQSVGSILSGGFDASYYSDIQKKSKFLGITTGTKTSTQYTGADGALEQQFTLLLRSFNDAILAAAGPLGVATGEIQNRLNSFVVNIGKIDLKGLTGEQIQEKLTAVFGAAADSMANAAFPGIAQFQKVGEGAFETLVRVASTVEAVGNTLDMLGKSAEGMGLAAKLGLVDQFESISALTDAADSYFQSFYTKEEQAAARTAQMGRVFDSLGVSMPSTLAAFRQLVEAQDLTTAAGQETYATLLKLAPAFADLQSSLEGAKSAADIATERTDLQRQLLQLQGDTAAIRALDLAKLDGSNRALQQQIWAIQDAQEAAKAADELRQAWVSVGDSIMDEVKRIRGLNGVGGDGSFASLMGQFNAATSAARGGDMDAAKSLPQLSQALLKAAEDSATSRQELARVQAQTAASLEATYGVIGALTAAANAPATASAAVAAAAASQAVTSPSNDNSTDLRAAIDELRDEVAQLRSENTAGHAANAAANNKTANILDRATQQSGGDAISTVQAA